jgi:hypothetical protein
MLSTVAGTVLLALGVAIGWYGLRPLAVLPRVLRADVAEPSDVTSDGSFVVTRGVASESTETIAAPFTGTQCLGFEFEVTERQPSWSGIPWVRAHLDDGVATRPFVLEGPGGRLDVVPSPKRFGLDTDTTVIALAASETPPDRIRRFVDVRDGLEPVSGWIAAIPGFGARRYVERRIDPGEAYLVAGRTERTRGEVALAGDLVITDRSPKRFAIARLRDAVFPTVVALAFVAVGVAGLVV